MRFGGLLFGREKKNRSVLRSGAVISGPALTAGNLVRTFECKMVSYHADGNSRVLRVVEKFLPDCTLSFEKGNCGTIRVHAVGSSDYTKTEPPRSRSHEITRHQPGLKALTRRPVCRTS
jgi:hypothetical protein